MARKRNDPARDNSGSTPTTQPTNPPEDQLPEPLRYVQLALKVDAPEGEAELTPEEAEEWLRLMPKYGRYEVDGINPPGGKRVPVTNRDYRVTTGKHATVCPRAKPQLGDKLVGAIADSLRRRGLIDPTQTIHWTGPQAEVDAICECDLAAVQATADSRETISPPPTAVTTEDGDRPPGGVELISGGFAYRGKPYNLTGRPRDMLKALLESRFRRLTTGELLDAMNAVNEIVANDPRQCVWDTTGALRAALRIAAEDAGVTIDDPLPSEGKGKDLTYILALK